MAKYGPKSKQKVKETMREYKRGTLKSGRSGAAVKNPKQAIAIGLSKARKEGAKVPPPKKSTKTPKTASHGRRASRKSR